MKSHDVFILPNNGIYMKVILFPTIKSLGFGAFTMLDSTGIPILGAPDSMVHSHWGLVRSQCWILSTQVWILLIYNAGCTIPVCQIPWHIHIGIWCVHNAGFHQPKSGCMIPILGVRDSMVGVCTFILGFGAFTILDTIDPSLDFVDLQCWMHDRNIRCARFHAPYLYIHIGIWCIHNAGYYRPKSGFR